MRIVALNRRWLIVACLASLGLVLGDQAWGLIVINPDISPTSPNYNAPAGSADPGWANLVQSRSSIYLGDGWVISARHAGRPTTNPEGGGSALTTVTLDSGTYDIIPNSAVELTNPSDLIYTYHFKVGGNEVGTEVPASNLSDIVMYRIDTAERYAGTPEQRALDQGQPLKDIFIADTTPGFNTPITILASGGTKTDGARQYWDVDTTVNPNKWTLLPSSAGQDASGYLWDNDQRQKAWGTNNIARDSDYPNEPSDTNNTLVIRTPNNNRHTISHAATFNPIVNNNEAMAAAGDSGGGVFYQDNGEWRLLGVLQTITAFSGQPGETSVFGQMMTFANFADPHYYAQIDAARSLDSYSVVGDVNLDGIVSGDGTGSWETDDVTAFIDGWTEQSLRLDPQADIISWKMGDLNQDAVTNVADFLLLREALGASGASLNLAALLTAGGAGAAAIPEPGALGTVTFAGLTWLAWRSSRRRKTRK